jgi:hypothetical protein
MWWTCFRPWTIHHPQPWAFVWGLFLCHTSFSLFLLLFINKLATLATLIKLYTNHSNLFSQGS